MKIAEAFLILRYLVATGEHPTFDRPEAFSEYLCKFWLPSLKKERGRDRDGYFEKFAFQNEITNDVIEIHKLMPWQGGSGNYQRAFREYMRIVAPDGVIAARGLSALPITSYSDVMTILDTFGHRKDGDGGDIDDNYSMNLAYASGDFAGLSRDVNFRYLEAYLGEKVLRTDQDDQKRSKKWPILTPRELIDQLQESETAEKYPKETLQRLQQIRAAKLVATSMLESGAKPTERGVGEHAKKTLSSMLIVAKVLPQYLKSFGGDSESGVLQEAELKVDPLCTVSGSCLQHVFVLSPFKLDAPRATLAERKKWCLSYYYEWKPSKKAFETYYLHPGVKCDDRRVANRFNLIREVPKTHTWYRIV